MRRPIVAVAAVGMLAAGCGSSSSERPEPKAAPSASPSATEQEEPVPTESPTVPAESPTADPFAPNTGARALKVGQSREGQQVVTTVLETKYPYPPAQYRKPEPGVAWFGFRVKTCVRKSVTQQGDTGGGIYWSVVDRDAGNYQGGKGYWVDFPSPGYPSHVSITGGDCVSGWMLIDVPKGTGVKKLVWRPNGQLVAEWKL